MKISGENAVGYHFLCSIIITYPLLGIFVHFEIHWIVPFIPTPFLQGATVLMLDVRLLTAFAHQDKTQTRNSKGKKNTFLLTKVVAVAV